MKLMKNDFYGSVDYIGLVDWAYVYMSKKPHCKERMRLFNLAEKKSIVRNNVRMLLLGKKYSKRRCNLLIKRVINKKTDDQQRYANPYLMFSNIRTCPCKNRFKSSCRINTTAKGSKKFSPALKKVCTSF